MSNPSSSAAAAPVAAGKSKPRTTKRQRATKRSSSDEDGQQTYYNRLIHQCGKDLHKQAKVTRNFEVQKLIRKLKEHKPMPADENKGDDVDEDCHNAKKHNISTVKQKERKLQQLKDYDLEAVIRECYRRLGVLQLNPQLQHQQPTGAVATAPTCYQPDKVDTAKPPDDAGHDLEARNHPTTLTTTAFVAEDSAWILERILQHKSMISALEKWNEQVTEYRRWCLRQQERSEGISPPKIKKKQKQGKSINEKASSAIVVSKNDPLGNGSSLFVTLGGGDDEDDRSDPDAVDPDKSSTGDIMDYYGPAGTGNGENLKKNRQGQRGRRAKAAALEAKKRGRTLRPEDSLNWRQPNKKQQDSGGGSGNHHQQHGSKNASILPPSVPPPEHLHPSWQARKEKKEGIVAFQGKKITFGDDD